MLATATTAGYFLNTLGDCKMNIGDFVKVIDENITGEIIDIFGNLAIIIDDASEFDDNRLEYKISELELVTNRPR